MSTHNISIILSCYEGWRSLIDYLLHLKWWALNLKPSPKAINPRGTWLTPWLFRFFINLQFFLPGNPQEIHSSIFPHGAAHIHIAPGSNLHSIRFFARRQYPREENRCLRFWHQHLCRFISPLMLCNKKCKRSLPVVEIQFKWQQASANLIRCGMKAFTFCTACLTVVGTKQHVEKKHEEGCLQKRRVDFTHNRPT